MYFSFHRRFGCLVRHRRIFDHRGKPVDGSPARAGRDVCAVDIHGEADGRMPQLALHILDVFPFPDQTSCVAVRQIVEPDSSESGLPETPRESLPQARGVERHASISLAVRRWLERGYRKKVAVLEREWTELTLDRIRYR
jgi:hypothetical protein